MRQLLAELGAALTALDGVAAAPAEEAETILLVESLENKFRAHAKALAANELVRAYPDRVFVFDQTDQPVPFLPGAYVSLERTRQNPLRTRPVPNWGAIDAETAAAIVAETPERLLFSFRGHLTSRVRAELFEKGFQGDDVSVARTSRFWDYMPGEADRLDYLRELRASRFVLCPRGRGTSTLRLYETMQLGRVPVVLADDWAPPAGVDWNACSIRVSERDVRSLREILSEHEARADELGDRAREAWEAHCRPGPPLLLLILEQVEAIRAERERLGWDEAASHRRWSSHRFRWRHGIHPVQGALAAARGRQLVGRLRDRL